MRKTDITDIKVKAVRKLSSPDFLEYHKNNDTFGDEWTEKFLEYVNIPLRKSIRINTLKISPDQKVLGLLPSLNFR